MIAIFKKVLEYSAEICSGIYLKYRQYVFTKISIGTLNNKVWGEVLNLQKKIPFPFQAARDGEVGDLEKIMH